MHEAKGFRAMRIFFTGVGGQGTLLATRLVGEAALEAGIPVTMSEIHGMAQRGGVVESSVVMGDALSPTIADCEADVLMAFEPLEAVRALPKCFSGSIVISSTTPIVPFTVAIGQSTYPSPETLDRLIKEKVSRLLWVDADRLAREAGSDRAANTVLVGALAGSGQLPICQENWREALQRIFPPRLLHINQQAFELGWGLGSGAFAAA
jgi:indolepyruvate ferredoxin oxidoreductase, beta subunit